MQKINSETDLRNAILRLESKQAYEGQMLKEQFHLAYDSMKPVNILKNTFKAAIGSKELKADILTTTVGLTTGYLSKKLFEKVSHNPFRKLLGSALMFGITSIVTKNPRTVKSLGSKILKIISHKQGHNAGAEKAS
ncbi:MAG: hypothetical protein ABUT20_28875 [Bacteroidota bacterium]